MAKGTGLAPMEAAIQEEREQRLVFQERIATQLNRVVEMFEKQTQRNDACSGRSSGRNEGDPHSSGFQGRNQCPDFKIDIPAFNGENVDDWLFKIEEYFDIGYPAIEQRVKIASFHMVGAVYSWCNWLVRNNYTDDWVVFSAAIQQRFGSYLFENLREALKNCSSPDQ